jgi:hypothetical protein
MTNRKRIATFPGTPPQKWFIAVRKYYPFVDNIQIRQTSHLGGLSTKSVLRPTSPYLAQTRIHPTHHLFKTALIGLVEGVMTMMPFPIPSFFKVIHTVLMQHIRTLSFISFFFFASFPNGLGAVTSSSQTSGSLGVGDVPTIPDLFATEVTLTLVVNPLANVPDELRSIVQKQGGLVVEYFEKREDKGYARFTIRIDSAAMEKLVSTLLGLGQLDERRVSVADVNLDFTEMESLQSGLQAALQRYDQLLIRSTTISDALAIENERRQIQREIEQSKVNQRQLRDRVMRSLLYVKLTSVANQENSGKW